MNWITNILAPIAIPHVPLNVQILERMNKLIKSQKYHFWEFLLALNIFSFTCTCALKMETGAIWRDIALFASKAKFNVFWKKLNCTASKEPKTTTQSHTCVFWIQKLECVLFLFEIPFLEEICVLIYLIYRCKFYSGTPDI